MPVLPRHHNKSFAYTLRQGDWKCVAYVGYPSHPFDLACDLQELHDLSAKRCVATGYRQAALRQWRRQAERGLYAGESYSPHDNPSSDYWKIMDNCFTIDNQDDEAPKVVE